MIPRVFFSHPFHLYQNCQLFRCLFHHKSQPTCLYAWLPACLTMPPVCVFYPMAFELSPDLWDRALDIVLPVRPLTSPHNANFFDFKMRREICERKRGEGRTMILVGCKTMPAGAVYGSWNVCQLYYKSEIVFTNVRELITDVFHSTRVWSTCLKLQ